MELSERLVKDFYKDENGNTVFTEGYLIRYRTCCGSGCRHCPYVPRHKGGATRVREDLKMAVFPRAGRSPET